MRKTIFSSVLILLNILGVAQVPQGFNYQAVAQNSSGAAIMNTTLQVKAGILSDTITPVVVWEELHSEVKTNADGVFNLVVGSGIRQTGSAQNFNEIDWSKSPLYLKIQIYYLGDWKVMGQSKLWSVPFAMSTGDISAPLKKLSVTGETDNMEEALFEVKNKDGQTIFAVYNEGVRIYVDDGDTKGPKGGFAIGGFGTTKAPSRTYFIVQPDSIRMYLYDTIKAVKGGFAIGGYGTIKNRTQNLFYVSTDSIRAYIDTASIKGPKGGFAIGGFGTTKSPSEEYLRVTRDSTRIYVNNIETKGAKGGFAIGGFGTTKENINKFLDLTPKNYFIGHEAGLSNTTGLFNSFIGYNAGRSNTEGDYNIFIGRLSGYSNVSGMANLFIGDSAGYKNIGGHANIFLGPWAGQESISGHYNISIGYAAGAYNISGNSNVSIGNFSGLSNDSGVNNVYIGTYSGRDVISGQNNVYLGTAAGRTCTNGSFNIFLGYEAGMYETASNRLIISNSNTSSPLIYGEFDTKRLIINGNPTNNEFDRTFFVNGTAGGLSEWFNYSDKTLKNNIITIPDALEKVLKLRGVNFFWNDPPIGIEGKQMGFIGQEAAEIIPEVVSIKNGKYSMQYSSITALLVEAIKDQEIRIENQEREISNLKEMVKVLLEGQTKKSQ